MQLAVSGFSGVPAGSEGAAATATPATPTVAQRQLQSSGQIPAAKRPATLTAMTGSAVPCHDGSGCKRVYVRDAL